MSKRKCVFNDKLQEEFPFLVEVTKYDVAHGSWSDIGNHLKCTKHKKALTTISSSSAVITGFFKKDKASEADLLVACQVGTWAYHIMNHGQSFKSTNCTSKLIKKMYKPKFSSARTKTEAIISSVLVPMAEEELESDLSKATYISVAIDSSNHKHTKLVPVIMHYFNPDKGVQTKLMELNELPGETADTLATYLTHTLKKNKIDDKCIAQQLKEFCDFVQIIYKDLLGHCTTHWLSLLSAFYPALQSYFLSQEKCPSIIKKFFSSPSSKLWFLFIHNQLSLFNGIIKKLERQLEVEALITKLEERKVQRFVGLKVKGMLQSLTKEMDVEETFMKHVESFYEASSQYLKKWNSLTEYQKFSWILLKEPPSWAAVEETLSAVTKKTIIAVDEGELFDDITYFKSFATAEKISDWTTNNVNTADRWVDTFQHFSSKEIPLKNLLPLVEYALSLPSTNAPLERVFSLANNMWTEEKTNLNGSMLRAMLIIKYNFNTTCSEFYEKLLKNK
uniref:HAT C-terminal dimerisation domain-containing protein n=1 Tax=Latimeria chalumnae TaxID=7897 RepID=H3AJ28_LATCH